jgi:hypothetical protein
LTKAVPDKIHPVLTDIHFTKREGTEATEQSPLIVFVTLSVLNTD